MPTTEHEQRRWRANAFVRMRAPELSLDHREFIWEVSEWMSQPSARHKLWEVKNACTAKGWLFWIEPEQATEEELAKCRPTVVRKLVKQLQRREP